ncbi:B-cell receptor CD22-like [Micropterus dolomieu]|uniref:B-cell receptor CD22-like n=1 Tax=Micropterus dolomieu TaxID=147949 RepID=UPI001E8CCB31|nr:B-cell receptor CD22-like [Micropterus dolomieu]
MLLSLTVVSDVLCVTVIQAQNGWGVTYTSTQICALKGSTVEISCTYTHPSRINDRDTTVEETFWFTKLQDKEHVDLRTDSEYAELQVQVIRSTVYRNYTEAELLCHNSCRLPDRSSYVWFKNGQKMERVETSSYKDQFYPGDIISCAVKGHEDFPSPSVYAPKLPSVSVSPSAEIVEGSSVTLTCSSDANPAAKYTWYKGNQTLNQRPEDIYHFTSSKDSGIYHCKAENELGQMNSKSVSIDVQYAPKLPVSLSADIVEGRVTLTCSSDANPAANYTWYKENEDSPKASGQNFTITDFRAEHSGIYYCEAQNRRGRHNSTLHLIVVAENSTRLIIIITLTLVVVMLIHLLLFCLWMRKKNTLSSTSEPNETIETLEEREEHLIELWEEKPKLYNTRSQAFSNHNSKINVVKYIEEKLEASGEYS